MQPKNYLAHVIGYTYPTVIRAYTWSEARDQAKDMYGPSLLGVSVPEPTEEDRYTEGSEVGIADNEQDERQRYIDEAAIRLCATMYDYCPENDPDQAAYEKMARDCYDAAEAFWAERERRRTK